MMVKTVCPLSMTAESSKTCNPACKFYDDNSRRCMLELLIEKKLKEEK